ncbi:MAG: bifunctional phosphoglucose/phosphomannose isomerase [Candidatus Marinimicrobia bacterium]|nr:bifunctional phosphoglucose/phosphomannose isomerase [Candidatus Neomarinimicrobiota bacterium]MBL7010784.1 bifunctional phosphoglucose/phosphomannose isomerase [Candidatus Neomarinimicrobiota bacterium]MBL7030685.1 bifunctional phosphoglucose/phosphomannose isomerase [Candidatus Neomarinimicrobiota bacterium]
MASYQSIDPDGMHKSIYEFPDHMLVASKIGESISLKKQYSGIRNVVVAGMGGSAIGGDVVRILVKNEIQVPMVVSRNYKLPNWVNRHTLVICSSYSGNTEETLAAFEDAREKGAQIVGISTGGILTERMNDLELEVVVIPSGLQPRAALAISFIPMMYLLNAMDLIGNNTINQLSNAATLLMKNRNLYAEESNNNPTYSLAQRIYKTIPVIYGETEATAILAVRWKGQLSENAKMLAYYNELPEMNHNEIVGWDNNKDLIQQLSVIWLKDENDHPRTSIRQASTRNIIGDLAGNHEVVFVEGNSLVERYLHLVHYGDWVSYWCAILHETDPTPVKKINHLKEILSEKS